MKTKLIVATLAMLSLSLVAQASACTSLPRGNRWIMKCDFNKDGTVSLKDLVMFARHYGETYECGCSYFSTARYDLFKDYTIDLKDLVIFSWFYHKTWCTLALTEM